MLSILDQHRVIPVLSCNDPETGVAIGRALMAGGIQCVEVALRTPNALQVLEALRRELPELLAGVGTVRKAADFMQAQRAGAQFAVSPGATSAVLDESENWDLPYLPAAATVSEMMSLQDRGYRAVKLFPAGQMGGPGYLKALAAPLYDIRLVPSGGVNETNVQDYFAIPQVAAVSGSWMIPDNLVEKGDWQSITQLCKSCQPS